MKLLNKKWLLSPRYRDIVLNHREVLCISYLLKDFSVDQIAQEMRLSNRTIAFYIDNIMLQLNCSNLSEFLHCIRQSELRRFFEIKE